MVAMGNEEKEPAILKIHSKISPDKRKIAPNQGDDQVSKMPNIEIENNIPIMGMINRFANIETIEII